MREEAEKLAEEFAAMMTERFGAHSVLVGWVCSPGEQDNSSVLVSGDTMAAYGIARKYALQQETMWRQAAANSEEED